MPKTKTAASKKAPVFPKSQLSKHAKPADGASIVGGAMLVNVKIRLWEARVHDRKVTAEVNTQHKAASDAGRYHKHLFGGKVKSHGHVINAGLTARFTHYRQTLPWTDDGWRLLPITNYYEYMEALRKARREFHEAVEAFIIEYPELVKDAEKKLNGMYDAAEYPSASRLRLKFSCEVEFSPLPTGEDFRVSLPKEEMKRMVSDVEDRLSRSMEGAMEDLWRRLAEAVGAVSKRLDDEGRYLKDDMLTKLRDVAEAAGRLNIANNPQLEQLRKQAIAELTTTPVDTLKNQPDLLEAKAKKARDILKAMEGLYTPKSTEEEEDE